MIEVNNLTKRKIDEKFLKGLAKKVLKEENREEVDLSIALVGRRRIKELNKKYRKKNEATDVLSFGAELNEVVICPAAIKIKKELARVLVHGILHILGYGHGEKMSEKQNKYLILWQNRIL